MCGKPDVNVRNLFVTLSTFSFEAVTLSWTQNLLMWLVLLASIVRRIPPLISWCWTHGQTARPARQLYGFWEWFYVCVAHAPPIFPIPHHGSCLFMCFYSLFCCLFRDSDLKFTNRLGALAREPQGSACLCLPSTWDDSGLQTVLSFSHMGSEQKTLVSGLHCKYFYRLSHIPGPRCNNIVSDLIIPHCHDRSCYFK